MVFSKFRPFTYRDEINDNSDFVCSLYSDDNKYLRNILKNGRLYASNFLKFNDAREGWFNFLFSKREKEEDIVKALKISKKRKQKDLFVVLVKNLEKTLVRSSLCGRIMLITI